MSAGSPPPFATVDAPGPDPAEHRDMADQQPLIRVPWRELATLHTLRGGVLVLLAVAVLLWPSRSNRVVAVLLGIGLGIVAVTVGWELVRRPASRRFGRVLVVAACLGAAPGLVLHATEALVTTAQLAGAGAVVLAVGDLVLAALRRRLQAWTLARDVMAALLGGVLLAFPEQTVTGMVVLAAALAGGIGLGEILAPISSDGDPSLGRGGRPAVLDWLTNRPSSAEERDVLLDKVYFEGDAAPTRFARFLALMAFASVIASVGVVVESTAVVIGAMLIAPLMVPLMGLAMSVPMGWPRRMARTAGIAASGITVAISTGALVGAALPRTIDVTTNTEILARISPTMVDLAIAVAAGGAGAYALSRRDVSDSLPGVAVAIALVPPLTVVGLCWQEAAWSAGSGALLLFLTNAIAIVLAGGATFVVVGAAPIDRVSHTQERIRTVVAGLVSLAVVIVLLLALNGAELTRSELARAGIDETLAAWTEEHPRFRVEGVVVRPDSTIVIDLAGPGEPPGLEALAGDLRDAAGDDVPVDVTWVLREHVTLTEDGTG